MRFRRRKGISYILEVAMMTLVVVALATVVLTWGLGQVSNSRIALTGAVNDRINRAQESINVEDVQALATGTLRLYIRNTGSIQVVIDAIYVNNVNTAIAGVCPAGSFQAGQVPVTIATTTSTTTASATFSTTLTTTASLTLALSPVWTVTTTTTSTITTATVTSANLGTAGFNVLVSSPHPGGNINWSTNFTSCPGGTGGTNKLSLAINAIGAVDVTVPTSVSCTPSSLGTGVCSGSTYTVTASTNRGTTFTGSFTV